MSTSRILTAAVTVAGVFLAMPLVAWAPPGATVIYVDDDNCPGPGDGSEADPYCSIQTAIDNAGMEGDEIVVAPGTYAETIDFMGKAVWLHSSDGAEVTIIDGTGNFHVVQCVSGEGAETVLEGFTITGGNANGPANPDNAGGGMYNEGSSPTVTNCTFNGNLAGFGGGMYNEGSETTITGCTFAGNTADGSGGGMYNANSSPMVVGCTFRDNSTPIILNHAGGAIHNLHSHLTLVHSTFHDNQAWHGGAISQVSTSSLVMHDCLLTGNFSDVGGALFNQNSVATLTNCAILGNEVSGDFGVGGGILSLVDSASLTVVNSLMAMNVAEGDGGAISHFFDTAGTVVASSTIAANTAGGSGGGMFVNAGGEASVVNSVLWSNNDAGGQDESAQLHADGPLSVDFSCVQGLTGGFGGMGNIGVDPLFADPGTGDFKLSPGSPCIDAGDNTAVPEGIDTDLDGNPRFVDDPDTPDSGNGDPPIVDIGAYELLPCPWDLDGDDTVGVADLLLLIASFGPCKDCPADFNDDGVVNAADLVELIGNFGPCPGSACVWDVNGDGVVDQADLDQVVQNKGPCDGCPEDVNADGVVNGQDVAAVATHFGPCP